MAPRPPQTERNAQIMVDHATGATPAELAQKYRMSKKGIENIIKQELKRRAPPEPEPEPEPEICKHCGCRMPCAPY